MSSDYKFKKSTSSIVYFLVFIYLLIGMRCWIGYGNTRTSNVIFPIFMFLAGIFNLVKYQFNKRNIIYFLLVLFTSWGTMKVWNQNFNAVLFFSIPAINILFVLAIPDDDKEKMLKFVIKWFGIILLPSIIIYILVSFTHIGSPFLIKPYYGDVAAVDKSLYYNYLFLIYPSYVQDSFVRFCGPFTEPGDLGCASAFILFAAKYDFQRYPNLKIILVALLLSFSLAGIVLVGIGYVFNLFLQDKIKMYQLFLFLLVIITFYVLGLNWNDGNNPINEKIISRFAYNEERGFEGNNRSSWLAMQYYEAMFDNRDVLLWGYDSKTFKYIVDEGGMVGAGYISKIIQIGLVGIICLCLPYFWMTITSNTKKYAWSFFILFLLYMFQRCDSTWIVFVLSYVYGIVISEREQQFQNV